jgi:bifunctional DNase/RNase
MHTWISCSRGRVHLVVEMHLVGVRVEMPTNNPIVLLREAEGDHRVLPIFIGAVEATAIAFALQGVTTQRPMTHDLMRDLLGALEVEVSRIVVTDLRDGTFFAEVHMVRDGNTYSVSSRPSDAIALAARTGSPIFAAEGVLDEAAIAVTEEEEEEQEDEVEAFREFLEGVNPEDFAS